MIEILPILIIICYIISDINVSEMIVIFAALLIFYVIARIYVWHISWKWMRYLPTPSNFIKIRCARPIKVRKYLPLCSHDEQIHFTIIDSTEGSGWMSDTLEGMVCTRCGRVMDWRKTY